MKALKNNINRVDLLSDARIGDIKDLMKTMTNEIIKLSKRVQLNETGLFKRMYDDLPIDVMALTKSEVELKQDLADMIGKANEMVEKL